MGITNLCFCLQDGDIINIDVTVYLNVSIFLLSAFDHTYIELNYLDYMIDKCGNLGTLSDIVNEILSRYNHPILVSMS